MLPEGRWFLLLSRTAGWRQHLEDLALSDPQGMQGSQEEYPLLVPLEERPKQHQSAAQSQQIV